MLGYTCLKSVNVLLQPDGESTGFTAGLQLVTPREEEVIKLVGPASVCVYVCVCVCVCYKCLHVCTM